MVIQINRWISVLSFIWKTVWNKQKKKKKEKKRKEVKTVSIWLVIRSPLQSDQHLGPSAAPYPPGWTSSPSPLSASLSTLSSWREQAFLIFFFSPHLDYPFFPKFCPSFHFIHLKKKSLFLQGSHQHSPWLLIPLLWWLPLLYHTACCPRLVQEWGFVSRTRYRSQTQGT